MPRVSLFAAAIRYYQPAIRRILPVSWPQRGAHCAAKEGVLYVRDGAIRREAR